MIKIDVSDEARRHIEKNINNIEGAVAFLLSLKPDGCSGYQFDFKAINEIDDSMIKIFDSLCIHASDEKKLSGLKITVENNANFGFKLDFQLPSAVDHCGCGKSFKFSTDTVN